MTRNSTKETQRAFGSATESLFPETRSPAELRALLRTQGQVDAMAQQLVRAEQITACAVGSYWNALGSGLRLLPAPRSDAASLSAAAREAARQFGNAVAAFPVHVAAEQLGLLYTSLLPEEHRAQRGIFYTPPSLAERLLDQAEAAGVDWARAQVLDPAAGAGAFLIPLARRMLGSLGDCEPGLALNNLSARLRGFELESFAAWMAQVFVEAEALPWLLKSGRRLGSLITVGDSLLHEPTPNGSFDLVIGNPPYGRRSLSAEMRARYARSLYGHANLYGLFMDLSLRWAREGGVVSLLTPSSFLAGEYFKNLRKLLWTEAPPLVLDFVSSRKGVFEDVLQETVLASYRKGGSRFPAPVGFAHVNPGQAVCTTLPAGRFSLPEQPLNPWILARQADQAPLARRLRQLPSRLADWGYRVSTGPLVWNRHKPQFSDHPEPRAVPVLWAESVTADGHFLLRCEKRNHRPFLRLRDGDDWLVVRRPCVLLQRTTAREQARRLIAAELPAALLEKHGGVTVENHLNMLIPIQRQPKIPLAVLAAFLNSDFADRAFRCLSGSVAVSAYELEHLPLPDADDLLANLSDCSTVHVDATCQRIGGIDVTA